jgi:O-antigen/teichoic acid export membrane protein
MTFFLISSLITALISIFFVSNKIKLIFIFDKTLCFSLLKTGIPFGIINIINYLYFRFIPMALAKNYLTDSQFGVFDVSFRITLVLSLFSTFLMYSVMPAFKRSIFIKDWSFAYVLFKRSMLILAFSSIVLVGIGTWLGPLMIQILTHKNFIIPQFWFIFPLFLILAAISYFYDLMLITLFSTEHDIWILIREIFAFCSAGILFFNSIFILNLQLKIFVLIIGSITGETLIVTLGMIKIMRLLKNNIKITNSNNLN